ncbi:HTH domain-containing protein [Oscillatoria amoena NRMC-F 0135]|nr:HTH domain-containing protein [Oscillatoria amoena NRMC-F 0135]
MNRIDRLTAILIQLQTKRVVKAEEIASRFEISLRTVYRDVKALMEAGVPIGSEAGKGILLLTATTFHRLCSHRMRPVPCFWPESW